MSKFKKLRPTAEDLLRAVGYLNLWVWAVLLAVFPPVALESTTYLITRSSWLGIVAIGATMALVGSLLRIDIKLELPGILVVMLGPIFYAFTQFYFVIHPLEGADPTQRIALVSYALLGVTLLLPRLVGLVREKNRLKELNK